MKSKNSKLKLVSLMQNNETITSLQRENDTHKQRLQEMESRYASMKDEGLGLGLDNDTKV